MTQKEIINALGMLAPSNQKVSIQTATDLARRYKGLYYFIKEITTNCDYTYTQTLEFNTWGNWWVNRITIQYNKNQGSASFELPNHYVSDSHLNSFNSAIIAMLQAGMNKSICLPSKAAAYANNI
jgi:hypothetical protein